MEDPRTNTSHVVTINHSQDSPEEQEGERTRIQPETGKILAKDLSFGVIEQATIGQIVNWGASLTQGNEESYGNPHPITKIHQP